MFAIKNIRNNAKLTQQELADKVGTTREYISSIENNHRMPSIEMLGKIAEALNTTVKDLLEETA